jgi:polyisoprenoid-binding protein YceI
MRHSKMSTPLPADSRAIAGSHPARESVQMILNHDHDRLDRLFRSMVYAMDSTDPIDLRSAWMAFECEIERHLDLEDEEILPLFARSRPGEARVLKEEHGQIRAQLLDLGIELDLHCLSRDRVRAFAETLRAHARHEDALLYPWASRYLGATAVASVTDALGADAQARAARAATGWWIDATSTLEFSLRHIVVGQIRGRFIRWGGTVRLDVNDVRRSTVRIWIDLASVDTGDQERDDQVRSSEFFDIPSFPRAVFTGTRVDLPEGGHPVIVGALELHGVTAEVAAEITDDLPWLSDPEAPRMSFPLKARLDRRQFGLRWNQDLDIGGIVVGDRVDITGRIDLVRARSAPMPDQRA